MSELGFIIDNGIVRYDGGGCHPATREEKKMWAILSRLDDEGLVEEFIRERRKSYNRTIGAIVAFEVRNYRRRVKGGV